MLITIRVKLVFQSPLRPHGPWHSGDARQCWRPLSGAVVGPDLELSSYLGLVIGLFGHHFRDLLIELNMYLFDLALTNT
jgi:hypothetical protein